MAPGHRAKGVVYNPETERRNYVPTVLPRRYDAFIFIAETTPLTALGDYTTPADTTDHSTALKPAENNK